MSLKRVRISVVTSHQIDAYGGFQLSEDQVEDVAATIGRGELPMHFGHDISRPLDVITLGTGVERLPDGHLAAWVEFDVDEDAWAVYEAECEAVGAPGGMSVSFTSPVPGQQPVENPAVVISGDAANFDDEDLDAAAKVLERLGSVEQRHLFQLTEIPDAKVVIEFFIAAGWGVTLNLVASTLYDAGRKLLLGDRPTIFNLEVKKGRGSRRSVKLHVAVNNKEEWKAALDRLPTILESATEGTFAYDPSNEDFKEIEGGKRPESPE
jgi:hypothetical protein